MPRRRSDLALFWGIIAGIITTDVLTKRIAAAQLVPRYVAHSVLGDWLQLRLVYNQGAAFGIYLGAYSRWIFIGLTVVAVILLGRMFVHTASGDWMRTTALAMVIGGALGNLVDRLRSAQGVVDFIDVGVGVHRWPTFNVADMGVSVGAVLLALVLWQEDEAESRASASPPAPASPERSA
jgi:signal peptidase II